MNTRREIPKVAGSVTAMASVGVSAVHAKGEPPAKVTGPICGGGHDWPFGAYYGEIGNVGYAEEEYFIEGEAMRYTPAGPLDPDGKWLVDPVGTAPFSTRLIVQRPKDPTRFNGTVIVEWLNVTGGYDYLAHDLSGLFDNGFAYVGVSAQYAGLFGLGPQPQGLTQWDSTRYASLVHPGDSCSYDIFSQAARAVGANRLRVCDPLRGLEVKRLIAVGASQSAGRLATYANAIQPRDNVFDAIILAVWFGNGASFDDVLFNAAQAMSSNGGLSRPPGAPTRVRDDLRVPVMVVNSETETLSVFPVRQPDTDRFCFWEVAGASHASEPTKKVATGKMMRDFGAPFQLSNRSTESGSQISFMPVLNAATLHMHRWINGGPAPVTQPRIEVAGAPPHVVRDSNGIARGGLRLPDVDVPIGMNQGGTMPMLQGIGKPFGTQTLQQLYSSHEAYVQKVADAARAAGQVGLLLPSSVQDYIWAAQTAPVPPGAG